MKPFLFKLLALDQEALAQFIKNYLEPFKDFYKLKEINGNLIVTPKAQPKESFMPFICSHLDTINTHFQPTNKKLTEQFLEIQGETLAIKKEAQKYFSCLGGDDRCGVFVALNLINARMPYVFGFFRDEEIGCIGSSQSAEYINTLENLSCFIGLDRKGGSDCAIYGADNDALINIFSDFGYNLALGSSTDAARLAEMNALRLACVNLSVGYKDEHKPTESINLKDLGRTLEVLKTPELIKALSKEQFLSHYEPWDEPGFDDKAWIDNFFAEFGYFKKG